MINASSNKSQDPLTLLCLSPLVLPVAGYGACSLGWLLNIKMVLGESPLVWCNPFVWGVASHFDGINWEAPDSVKALNLNSPC
jgi:hypothetical protein